ncbi:hypothetical protein GCM10007938_33590 [Vibrio zhanjiangensis]|uniref:DUF4400 domain-containing protein n=1 Tax=Vibrio zhanjiangensis TaxID=1046128 RepID=A0ABQ6F2X7_9VIBR|nr:DUF4400 domain-containing protein [Vibrio zhanjiangensis]GLT19577.1 hypothetical protein GCM10007938_33590 [Vibrio zhanjiangensis]
MSKTPRTEPKRSEHDSYSSPLTWPLSAIFHTGIIWVLLVALEWSGYLGPTGQHSRSTFIHLIESLESQPGAQQWVFVLFQWILDHARPLVEVSFVNGMSWLQPYWQGVVYVTLSLITRLLLLVMAMPLFMLVVILAFLDGLVVRQRRIAMVGRETETIHYYAKRLMPWAAALTGYLWLLLPGVYAVATQWLILPGVGLFGLMVHQSVASYKKFV